VVTSAEYFVTCVAFVAEAVVAETVAAVESFVPVVAEFDVAAFPAAVAVVVAVVVAAVLGTVVAVAAAVALTVVFAGQEASLETESQDLFAHWQDHLRASTRQRPI
jgi:hypothetical protein